MSKVIQSTCNYCGVGCNVDYHINDDGSLKQVKGNPEYTVNKGVLCPKGFKIHEPILSKDRANSPLVKKNGKLESASWDEALTVFTDKVKEIQSKYGKEAFAFVSTGQLYTEEMAILGQVGRTGMGTHGDGNTRQCMASAVVAYKHGFGFDSPPMTYKDIEESDCVILVGSNAPINHPTVWNRLKKYNTQNPDIIVMDPRFSDAAKKSTLHIPIKPKRDLIFLYMVMNVLIKKGWIDQEYIDAHTNGFEELKTMVNKYNPDDVEERTGVSRSKFDSFVEKVHTRKKVSIWWTMGVNQSHQGTRTASAIINLCLITGNIGRPGTGPCSLTGQSNAMGSRLFSNTTSLYGGRDHTKEEDRNFVGKVLGIDPDRLPKKPTLAYDKIIEGVATGDIKGLWVVCTNPLHSWIDNSRLKKMISNLEILVVQDLYSTTTTARYADVFLPAQGAGEKQGFLINSERRIGLAQQALTPPDNTLSDFEIFKRVAKYYGCEDVIKGWDTPEDVFKILRACSEGTPCDFTGIRDYNHLLEKRGIQWPYPKNSLNEDAERRLFADGKFFTPNGKANLQVEEFIAPACASEPSEEYPIYLLTGRGTIFQFQSNTRTQKSETLKKVMADELYVEINPENAEPLNIENGAKVRITSATHSIVVDAKVTDSVLKDTVFLPFHYVETNLMTRESFDPHSRQPSFKIGAVRLEAV